MATEPKTETPQPSPATQGPVTHEGRISFSFEKGNFFRVVHADGVFGGLTPRGDFHMAFFSERQPIPKQVTHVLTSDTGGGNAKVGDEIRELRIARAGIFRELEVDVVMNRTTASSLLEWLAKQLRTAPHAGPQQIPDSAQKEENEPYRA